MKQTKASGKYFWGFILTGLFLFFILKVFGTLIPQLEGVTPNQLSPGDASYPPGNEPSKDSAYPPPDQTLQIPSPTTRYTDIPFQDLITNTILPITPFPTLTLQPGPSATPIPLITPANDSAGTILFIAQAVRDTSPGLFQLGVDAGGVIKDSQLQLSDEAIQKDSFAFASSDGKRYAITGEWGVWNIYTISHNQVEKKTYSKGGNAQFYNWFPDNQNFLWGEGALILEDLISGLRTRLAVAGYDGLRGAAASPNGQYVVYSYSTDKIYKSGIWIIDSTGQNSRLLSSGESPFNFSWSPDGKQIAFWGSHWEVVNADGSNRRSIAEGVFLPQCYPLPPLWSPDSRTIAVVTSSSGDAFCHGWGDEIFNGTNIVLIDVESGKANPLLKDGSMGNIDPAWSPDGSQIVFVSNRNGSPQLWAVKIDGINLHPLTENATLVRFPVWSK